MKFEVGQRVWMACDGNRSESQWATVSKVGRVWITVKGERWGEWRFDRQTLCVDGKGYAPWARLFATKDEHDAEVQLLSDWLLFRRCVENHYRAPVGVTLADIEKARELLKLPKT